MKTDWIAGFLGTWSTELTLGAILLRLALSMALAAIIGCERSPKKESRSERSSDDTGSSSPTSRKSSKNDRPSIGEQLQSFREKLSGVEPRVPAREKMHSEITK